MEHRLDYKCKLFIVLTVILPVLFAVGFLSYHAGKTIQWAICTPMLDSYKEIIAGYHEMLAKSNDTLDMNRSRCLDLLAISKEELSPPAKNAESGADISKFVNLYNGTDTFTMLTVDTTSSCMYACREPPQEGAPCVNCCYPIKEIENAK